MSENLQTGGGEFLQAHVGNLGNCPVAEFQNSANWAGFLQVHVGNLGNCPVADFRKSANWGRGEFLQAHVDNLGNCPVADFSKFCKQTGGGNFCKHM